MEFGLEVVNLKLAESLSLEHFQAYAFIFFSQKCDSLFEVGLLLDILGCQILNFSASRVKVLLQSHVLSLQRVQPCQVIFLQSVNLLNVVQLQLGLQGFKILLSLGLNVKQLIPQLFLFLFQSQNLVL